MLKTILLFCLILNSQFSNATDYPQYLTENNQYSASLLEFLSLEDFARIEIELKTKNLMAQKSLLSKATKELDSTLIKLTNSENELLSLQDKQQNKDSLLASLTSQKNQNNIRINSLGTQISSKQTSLSQVEDSIRLVENEKVILINDFRTQELLAQKAQANIERLKWDIQANERQIDRNQDNIQRLRARNQQLRDQINQASNENEKANLLFEINQNQNKMENLRNENQRLKNQNDQNSSQISFNQNDLSFAQNNMSSLKIRINGKNNELNSYQNTKNQFVSEISSLDNERSSLQRKNKSIDQEVKTLSNLPALIAQKQSDIQTYKATKINNEASVASFSQSVEASQQNLSQMQTSYDSKRANILLAENAHDRLMQDILPLPIADITTDESLSEPQLTTLVDITILKESKDWIVIKAKSNLLGQDICAAATDISDSKTGAQSELLVVKTIDSNGVFSSPTILVSRAMLSNPLRFGILKTDKGKALNFPLLQGTQVTEKNLMSRYSDTDQAIQWLKAHNSAKVEFKLANAQILTSFSLRGSSAMISEFEKVCKNPK